MSNLLLPRRFYSQPQGAVRINWSNPLTRGLMYVDGYPVTSSYVIPKSFPTPHGMGTLSATGYTGNFRENEGTFFAVPFWQGLEYKEPLLGIGNIFDNQAGNIISLRWNNAWDGKVRFLHQVDGTTSINYISPNTIRGDKLLLSGGPDGARAMINGAVVASSPNTTWTSGFATSNAGQMLGFNTLHVGSTSTSTMAVLLFLYFTRQLSLEESVSLSANPWQIFKVSE